MICFAQVTRMYYGDQAPWWDEPAYCAVLDRYYATFTSSKRGMLALLSSYVDRNIPGVDSLPQGGRYAHADLQ
jgi:hypothetical protein